MGLRLLEAGWRGEEGGELSRRGGGLFLEVWCELGGSISVRVFVSGLVELKEYGRRFGCSCCEPVQWGLNAGQRGPHGRQCSAAETEHCIGFGSVEWLASSSIQEVAWQLVEVHARVGTRKSKEN